MLRREFELCAETLQACEAAAAGGADRIELCAALGEGGVTPSRGLIRAVVAAIALPVHVLVRPRAGGFVYSDAEFAVMCADVEDALSLGAAGVVVGMLTASLAVDVARTREVVRLAHGEPVTFHRAFDMTADLGESLRLLMDAGVARVLTSGGEPNVDAGFASLERLAVFADGRVRIAAGGGVTLQNAARLAAVPGLDLHASLRPKVAAADGDPLWREGIEPEVSTDVVRAMAAIVHDK